MKRTLILLTIFGCLLPFIAFGQYAISEKIQQNVSTIQQTTKYTPLTQIIGKSADLPIVPEAVLDQKQFFQLQNQTIKTILTQKNEYLQMTLPIEGQNVELQLMKADIFTDDFRVVAASTEENLKVDLGVHYWGIVEGMEKSLATISFFEGEIVGTINFSNKEYTLGKVENSEYHILYQLKNLNFNPDFSCTTIPGNDGGNIEIDEEIVAEKSAFAPCVRIHIELDYDVFQQQGGTQNATNYMNGLFAEVALMYANENINVQLSFLRIWNVPSPYSSGNALNELNAQGYGGNNGDLVHLVKINFSGGIANLDVLCNYSLNTGVSGVFGNYQSVPTYSWDVYVITHELGHNFGSPHTHDCSWSGGAIDGCGPQAGFSEGCNGPLPSNGGTIMSYCHVLNTGVNFSLGFGPQPGNLIRSRYNNAYCLQDCGDGATCNDGIQNGNETGVDCGGSCSPCFCNDNDVTVAITLDNYPEETTWTLTNESGTTVASGDAYNNQLVGATVTENLCLADGCYTFTINDTYGDGICCGYGNGSYSATDANGTLASGGQFAFTESTDFCVGTGGGSTCDDGIQNGDETGVDCGGSCSACPTCYDGIQNGYETGVDCGGYCPACPTCYDGIQNGYETGIDCGGYCSACSTCYDGIQNGYETGIDCGGYCPACPTCYDGIQNGYETGVDCGGYCPACPTCYDGIQNGYETGIDCGGSCPACPPDDYCDAQSTSTNYEFIQSVALNGQTNNSGNDGGYGDYTGTSFATIGNTNTVTLTPGFVGSPYAENWRIWIDFNKDNDFDDAGEQVYTGTSSSTTSLTGTFNASEGLGTTTMRVVMMWNTMPEVCGSFQYGEVEDYTVTLGDAGCTPGTACNDNDPCTANETYDSNCDCTGGTLVDSDGDGVCNLNDACPGQNDAIIGTACNDNNICTTGETYNSSCNCTGGTFQDNDNDGVCDANDICPNGNDNIDSNGNGIPDACDTSGGDVTSPCVNGFAGSYPCNNIDLVGFLSLNQMGCSAANDIWGWTDPQTGKEYAIFGCTNKTAFIDISTPTNPVLVGSLLTNTSVSVWRDMKVFNNHAFIVSEAGGHGMQVFDLTRLRNVNSPTNFSANTVVTNFGNGISLSNSHNIVLNEASGYAYIVGSNTCSGGLTAINVNNPTSPTFAGCFSSDGYTHDAQCVSYTGPDGQYAGREICFNSNENTLTIVDVTNKSDMSQISRASYPGQRYTHQGWLTEDQRYFLMNDELDESQNGHNTRTHIWNVSNLDNPAYLGYYQAAVGSIDHNLYTKGNKAYLTNYRSGLRILDISNIASANLQEVAYFDTYPQNDAPSFNSAWSNYPYFSSGNIIVSDMEQGLFILKESSGGGCQDTDSDGLCDSNDPCPFDPTNTCNNGGTPDYCDAQGTNSTYEYIDRVIFGNMDNTSGNNGGYGDYTNQVITVGTGDIVPLGLTPGFSVTTYSEAWNVWIDFNRDGDYNDAGENVYSGTSTGTLTGNVNIPVNAALGTTGMRVAMQWQTPPSSCGSFIYGEVEDYIVNITNVGQSYNPIELRSDEGQPAAPAFRISPNPATDFINVALQEVREGGSIQVIAISGKLLWEQPIRVETSNLQIPVSNLPAGIYFIRLNFGSSTYATERFVKLR